MANEIFHFKLMNREEIIGELYDEYNEHYIIRHPMMIGERIQDGSSQIVLHKYLQFSEDEFVNIKVRDIICLCSVNPEFVRYYYNSIQFNSLYIDKNVEDSIKATNIHIENILADNDKKFNDCLKMHKIPKNLFSGSVN